MSLKKLFVLFLKKIEIGSAVAVRLTKYTGRSQVFIHPKHFLSQTPWYTKYLKRSDVVLDLGSGNGQSSIKASRFAKKVVGLEINKELIKIAKKSAEIKKLKNVTFLESDLEGKLNIKNNSFDKAIFLDVLEHLIKRDQILREIKRILKPRGVLFLGVPNSQTSWKKFQRSAGINSFSDPDHKIEFNEEEIKDLLKKHNFKIEKIFYGAIDTPFRSFFDIIGAFSIPLYKKISTWRIKKSQKNHKEAGGFEILCTNQK